MQAPSSAVRPTMLSYSRALLSEAKSRKLTFWRLEIAAAVLAALASLIAAPRWAALAALLGVAAKVASKVWLSMSRRSFRSGERARRYDFYLRTLGWPVPPTDRADFVLVRGCASLEKRALELAVSDTDYYATKGPPSTHRLLRNLAESMFWTERLMRAMAGKRWKHLAMAVVAVVVVLCATVLVEPARGGVLVLRLLGATVTMLVALDVLGEAQAFERGDRDVGRLLQAVTTEIRQADASRDEATRLLVEYNCLLADLPLLPDSIYENNKATLNEAWAEFNAALPALSSGA